MSHNYSDVATTPVNVWSTTVAEGRTKYSRNAAYCLQGWLHVESLSDQQSQPYQLMTLTQPTTAHVAHI